MKKDTQKALLGTAVAGILSAGLALSTFAFAQDNGGAPAPEKHHAKKNGCHGKKHKKGKDGCKGHGGGDKAKDAGGDAGATKQ